MQNTTWIPPVPKVLTKTSPPGANRAQYKPLAVSGNRTSWVMRHRSRAVATLSLVRWSQVWRRCISARETRLSVKKSDPFAISDGLASRERSPLSRWWWWWWCWGFDVLSLRLILFEQFSNNSNWKVKACEGYFRMFLTTLELRLISVVFCFIRQLKLMLLIVQWKPMELTNGILLLP